MDVELRHLRWFLALADELHFGRAAEAVFISQSALSKAVARLEAVVGAPLVDRGHGRVALTQAGEAFRSRARWVVRDADEAVLAARAASAHVDCVRVGYGIADAVLSDVVAAAERLLPDIQVDLVSFLYRDVTAGLATGETQLAFTMPQLDIPGIDFLPLGVEPLVVLIPEGHPAAARETITARDHAEMLRRDTWLLPPGPPMGTNSFRRFMAGCESPSARLPTTSLTYGSNEELAQMLAAGRGVALGFASLVPRYTIPRVVAVPAPCLPPGITGLAWRRHPPAEVGHVVEVARRFRTGEVAPGTVVAATTTVV